MQCVRLALVDGVVVEELGGGSDFMAVAIPRTEVEVKAVWREDDVP